MPATITHIPFTLTTDQGQTLYCDARFPQPGHGDAPQPLPVIIFAHGFKGFKDWGSFPTVCTLLAAEGFYAISFNFSHNGIAGHSQQFTQLDKFRQNTFSLEVDELAQVVRAVEQGRVPQPENAGSGCICLTGHSRGGGIALLAASRTPGVKAVATWASVADFNRYTDAQKARWRAQGVFETKNMRTGQIMQLGLDLLNDIEDNAPALNIEAAAAALKRPLLILHGDQDMAIKPEDAHRLYQAADPAQTTLCIIPATGHTFGAVHPFAGMTPALEQVIGLTADFFRKQCTL